MTLNLLSKIITILTFFNGTFNSHVHISVRNGYVIDVNDLEQNFFWRRL